MAKADLLVFLNKLDNELKRSSQEYRRFQANKRAHIFRFNAKDFSNQVKIQCSAQNIPLSNTDKKFINDEGFNLLAKLKNKLKNIKANKKKLSQGKTFVRMTFTSDVGASSVFGDPDSVYGKIYDTYRPCLKSSFSNIQDYLRDQEFETEAGRTKKKTIRTKTGKEREAAGRELNLGHVAGKSVIESFIRDAFEEVLLKTPVFTDAGDALSEADIRSDMQALGIDISIIKDAKIDTYTVQLEAKSTNQEDGQELKKKKILLQDQIATAIDKIGGIDNLKGSISIKENKVRNVRSKVLKSFKKVSGATVVAGEEIKQDSGKSQAKVKHKAKTNKAKTRRPSMKTALPRKLKARRSPAKKGVASNMLQWIAMINKKLPDTVRKKMNAPALENRTGRFANSVKVTDIVQTPKGFPSVGYTYAKNPYEVFEMGKGSPPWASPERDPRKLIDASIREIAVQLAIGRFFTRRV